MKKYIILVILIVVGGLSVYIFKPILKMNVVKSYNFNNTIKNASFVDGKRILYCYRENNKEIVAIKNVADNNENVIELKDKPDDEFTSLDKNCKYLFYVCKNKIYLHEIESKENKEYLIKGSVVGSCWSNNFKDIYILNWINNSISELLILNIEAGKLQNTGIKLKKGEYDEAYIRQFQEDSIYICIANKIYKYDVKSKSCEMFYEDAEKIEDFYVSKEKTSLLYIKNGEYNVVEKEGSRELDISYYVYKEKYSNGNTNLTSLYDKFQIVSRGEPYFRRNYISPDGKYLAVTGNSVKEYAYKGAELKVQILEIGKQLYNTGNIVKNMNLVFISWSKDSKYLLCQRKLDEKEFSVIQISNR